jgi:hypothetical protein
MEDPDLGGGTAASATFFRSSFQDFEIPDVERVHADIMNGEKIMVEAESIVGPTTGLAFASIIS